MNLTAFLTLPVLCHLNCFRAPHSDDANIVISNPPAISNQSPPPVQPTILPDAYIAYPEFGAAYKMIFNKVTWSEAREHCNLEGAHLAVVDSQKKMEYLRNATYYTYHRTDSYADIHVGVYRMDKKWVDVSTGKTLSALPWYSGFPVVSRADCAAIELFKGGECRFFNPSDCSETHFYLCEVPIPKDYKKQEFQTAQISVN